MPFDFQRLEIPEIVLIKPKVFGDERGFFMETFKRSDFERFGIREEWVQDNHSRSKKGVLRGLHYQLNPKAQAKLVRVVKGAVFDVAVDIRKGSPTYGKWVSVILSEENKYMIYIPKGFAHGVCILENDTELLYKVAGGEYSPEHDRSIRWNDPEINIIWPIREPILSERDASAPFLKDADNNFIYEKNTKEGY